MYPHPFFIRVFPASLLLSLLACTPSSSTQMLPEQNVRLLRSTQAMDSVFFSRIYSIACDEQTLYVSDYQNHRIIVADTALRFKYVMGREGKGPGEFFRCKHMVLSGSEVYVFDEGSRRIKVFQQQGLFLRSTPKLGFNIRRRFAIGPEGQLYLPANTNVNVFPILKLSKEGDSLASFGTIFPQPYEKPNIGVNGRFLFITEDQTLLAVGASKAVVECYTTRGALRSSCDLSAIPLLKSRIDAMNLEYQNFGTVGFVTVNLIRDACYLDGKLYLLLWEEEPGSPIVSNKLLVLDYDQGQLSPSAIIRLNPGTDTANYTTFCVFDQHRKVAAYELISGSIQVLQIEE